MSLIQVSNLTFGYEGSFDNVFENASFSIDTNWRCGFIGRNGAGKSTTLKSILGMVHPDAGEVRVFGMDYAVNERAIRRELGVVLGGIDFYPKKKLRVITDVTRRFYDNWDEDKYRHYLRLFAIDEEKRVDQLSSGMKVKYMIALALSHNARLLILDEPTSGLDPVSRDELMELLRRIVADGTRSVLFSTHITSDLEKCATHIAFIKDGELFHQIYRGEKTTVAMYQMISDTLTILMTGGEYHA